MHSAFGIAAFDRFPLQGKKPQPHNLPTTLHALLGALFTTSDAPFRFNPPLSLEPV
jgi:hypothetical protein